MRSHTFFVEGAVAERFATQLQNFAAVSRLKGEEEALLWFDAEGTKFAAAQVSKRGAEHVNRRSDELGYAYAGPSTEFCFAFAAWIGLDLDRYSLIVAAVGSVVFLIVYHGMVRRRHSSVSNDHAL